MIIRIMFLFGRSLSSLQVRPPCQTVSYAAVRSTNTAPAFFFASKESSMFCVSKTIDPLSIYHVETQPASLIAGVDNRLNTSVYQSFKDLVGDTEQGDGTVALWVPYRTGSNDQIMFFLLMY